MSQNNNLNNLNLPFNLDINTLASLASLLQQPVDEQKCPEVRFAEIMNIQDYINKSCRGNILPFNEEAKRMLGLDNKKLEWSSLTNLEDVDNLVKILNDHTTSNNVISNTSEEPQNYVVGTVIQMVIRLLAYSVQYRKCLSTVPTERLTSALSAFSDYRSALLDLSNPFTTVKWNVLISEFLNKAQNLLKLPINPYSDPSGDIEKMVSGISPFAITFGRIVPLDTNVSFLENLYRQAVGLDTKDFDKSPHIASYMRRFGFKEYVTHKIPMKRVINGASTCCVDPLTKTYYYTTLILDPFRLSVLKNLLIYEIVSGKAAYIHSALYFIMSMCTCEEDFQLMVEYGVIKWDFPAEGYKCFCEKMKELLDIMYCWKLSNTYTWHLDMIQIVKWKVKTNDTTNFTDFAVSCYAAGGLLKKEVSATLYSSLI
ncbi:6462_t:CDS:2 [Acaulospora morrowiae]|uniref:6462_t:CDS:1 n=1 Tax=Acaulospora morrowiae TaxID=94023 RepID=A0A9N8VAP0_9GLOM|nr:6462_t:CDS:2 [Acaulospora morrowiae]